MKDDELQELLSSQTPDRPVCAIPHESLSAFADRICVRDPAGLSPRPGLIPATIAGHRHLIIKRDFQIRYEYIITPQQGAEFQEITKDPNALHRTMNVVSGAMTAAKMLLPIEILLPFVHIRSARFRFRAPAFYGERTTSSIWWRNEATGGVRLEVTSIQRQQVVATGSIFGQVAPCVQRADISVEAVDKTQMELVTAFMRTLGIDGRFYFQKHTGWDFTYPVAYVASLPSGELVKQFQGNGGMITSLLLDLSEQTKIPIVNKKGPQVRLRLDRIKKAFSRIFADIINGVITHYRGWAVVNPAAEFPYLND